MMLHEQSIQDILKGLERGNSARFFIGALATWRIAEILLDESAPFDLAEKLRGAVFIHRGDNALLGEMHKALSCFWCLSVWVGWCVAILQKDKGWLITGFAYSAIAIPLYLVRKKAVKWLAQ